MNLAVEGQVLRGNSLDLGGHESLHSLVALLAGDFPRTCGTKPKQHGQFVTSRSQPSGWRVRGRSRAGWFFYPPLLPLVRLQAVQALHEAGDALLQAVDGVVLRVVPAEAVPQAAEGVPHQLQVTGLPKNHQNTAQPRLLPPQPSFPSEGKTLLTK